MLGQKIAIGPTVYTVNDDMIRAVGHYMLSIWRTRREAGPRAMVEVEKKLQIPEINGSGTVDHMVVRKDIHRMWIDDYKHGAGVYVSEVMNAQFLAYAIGAARLVWDGMWPGSLEITMTVHQPRFPDVKPSRSYTIKGGQLMVWMREKLEVGIYRSREPNAPLVAGDHCRFCPAKGICMVYLSAPKPPYQHRPITAEPVPEGLQF